MTTFVSMFVPAPLTQTPDCALQPVPGELLFKVSAVTEACAFFVIKYSTTQYKYEVCFNPGESFPSPDELVFSDNKGCPIFALQYSLSLCVFAGGLACFQLPQLSKDMRGLRSTEKP